MEVELEEQKEDICRRILVLSHSLSKIEISQYFHFKSRLNVFFFLVFVFAFCFFVFYVFFSRNILPRVKDAAYVMKCDNKKVKEHIRFHYLLTKMQMYTLIL